MSKIRYERGKTLTYPRIYPTLTFTPIFGHRGDFVWIEKVMAAWPEHDSEFAFVRDTVHDERVDRLKAENSELRELVRDLYDDAWHEYPSAFEATYAKRLKELGIEAER